MYHHVSFCDIWTISHTCFWVRPLWFTDFLHGTDISTPVLLLPFSDTCKPFSISVHTFESTFSDIYTVPYLIKCVWLSYSLAVYRCCDVHVHVHVHVHPCYVQDLATFDRTCVVHSNNHHTYHTLHRGGTTG